MQTISILGATGSVGQSTLKVIAHHKDAYDIRVLTANKNAKLLAEQAIAVGAKRAVVADNAAYGDLKAALSGHNIEAASGEGALMDAADEYVDWTMAAIVGMAGLRPLMHAIKRGGTIAIANKEPLVSAGPQVLAAAEESGATLLPVDSEHNAIFQVLEPQNKGAISRLIITASGGPFRELPLDQFESITRAQALDHPVWSMGAKISIDSATMMNKALELIEAHIFFGLDAKKIEALIHPQSIIHSMVEYTDGSTLAQMGTPDMCTPIAHALAFPNRIEGVSDKLDFKTIQDLSFDDIDEDRFPAINLAYMAMDMGQGACIAMNAANEICVEAFLNDKIKFLDIVKIVEKQMRDTKSPQINTIEDVILYDEEVRERTRRAILPIQNDKTKVA